MRQPSWKGNPVSAVPSPEPGHLLLIPGGAKALLSEATTSPSSEPCSVALLTKPTEPAAGRPFFQLVATPAVVPRTFISSQALNRVTPPSLQAPTSVPALLPSCHPGPEWPGLVLTDSGGWWLLVSWCRLRALDLEHVFPRWHFPHVPPSTPLWFREPQKPAVWQRSWRHQQDPHVPPGPLQETAAGWRL